MKPTHGRWLPASDIAATFAVHREALLRYSQRGVIGACWDEVQSTWLFDVERVAQLFAHRQQRASAPAFTSFGVLGEVRLGGSARREPAVATASGLRRKEHPFEDAFAEAG